MSPLSKNKNNNNNTTGVNADGTAPSQTGPTPVNQSTGAYDDQKYNQQNSAYPHQGQQHTGPYDHQNYNQQHPTYPPQGQQYTGAYDNQQYNQQNPAYPPQGQQPIATDQHRFNNGPIPATVHDPTQLSQGQYGTNHLGYGAGRGTVGHTQQDGAQINQGQYNQGQYGGQPPTSLNNNNFGYGAPGAGGQRVGGSAIAPANPTSGSSSLKGTVGKIQHAVGSVVGSNSLQNKGLEKQQAATADQGRKIAGAELLEAEGLEREASMRRERAVAHGAHPANAALGGSQRPYN